jgi:hypothetical protein
MVKKSTTCMKKDNLGESTLINRAQIKKDENQIIND